MKLRVYRVLVTTPDKRLWFLSWQSICETDRFLLIPLHTPGLANCYGSRECAQDMLNAFRGVSSDWHWGEFKAKDLKLKIVEFTAEV